MEKKVITYKDFHEIAQKNDYFLWHFLQKNQEKNNLQLWSVFKEKEDKRIDHAMRTILESFDVPYYESYVEDNIDFLNGFGIDYSRLWKPYTGNVHVISRDFFFGPVIIGFKKYENVYSTLDICYCIEGVVEVINKINPELILNYQG
jgi:hypothetical protein